jgi:hypothetical protein
LPSAVTVGIGITAPPGLRIPRPAGLQSAGGFTRPVFPHEIRVAQQVVDAMDELSCAKPALCFPDEPLQDGNMEWREPVVVDLLFAPEEPPRFGIALWAVSGASG